MELKEIIEEKYDLSYLILINKNIMLKQDNQIADFNIPSVIDLKSIFNKEIKRLLSFETEFKELILSYLNLKLLSISNEYTLKSIKQIETILSNSLRLNLELSE